MSIVDDEDEKVRVTEEGEVINVSAITSENGTSHEPRHTYEFLTKIEPVGIFDSTKRKSTCYNERIDDREYTAHCSNVESFSAKELKAQIMNIPYLVDEHDCRKKKTLSLPFESSFSTIDIVQKLKEIYRACSCRTCECIGAKYVTKPTTEDYQFRKCECEKCTNSVNVIDSNTFSNRYYINSTHDMSKNKEVCDCILCQCIVCENNVEAVQGCNCIYCECNVRKPQST